MAAFNVGESTVKEIRIVRVTADIDFIINAQGELEDGNSTVTINQLYQMLAPEEEKQEDQSY